MSAGALLAAGALPAPADLTHQLQALAQALPIAMRLPEPYLPHGVGLDKMEGAGEVQTPLVGPGARNLRPGDRVYLRHAKAGELCERFDRLYLVEGDRIVDELPTYRGEGRTFL